MISSESQDILLPNPLWSCSFISQSVMQKNWFTLFNDKVTARAYMIKNMTLSTILSELLVPWQPNLVWWYIILSQSVLWKKKRITAIQGQAHSEGSKCLCFVQMTSAKPPNILFSNLVLWYIITSLSVMQKDWFAIFKVKVTARAYMIKIWQCLLHLLSFWSFCYQTWFDSILS